MSTVPQTYTPAPVMVVAGRDPSLLAAELRAGIRGAVRLDEPMSKHTSFRIGGPADLFVQPQEVGDLAAVMRLAREKGLPAKVIGNGSNLLVSDKGIRGLVVRLAPSFRDVRWLEEGVEAGAGVALQRLVKESAAARLSGLESTVGIPGTLGGALATNAGTDIGSIGDLVDKAIVLDGRGEVCEWTCADFAYRYRHSNLRTAKATVVWARLRLQPADPEEIRVKTERLRAKRAARQPLGAWSAGSVFKNPRGVAAGKVLDRAGAKGMRVGDAEVSRSHANFFINRGQAEAAQVMQLIERTHALALRRYGIDLELEIEVVGAC
jgi:UDP-N-acetylmuramate dehydrogenase